MAEKFKYSEYYKKQVKDKLQKVRKHKSLLEKAEKDLEKEYKKIKKFVVEPVHIKILKFIALLIPIIIIIYLVSVNFILPRDFNYFYDIGSEQDEKSSYLSPDYRISNISYENNFDYRELTGHLVYFGIPIARGSGNVRVSVKFKDNFPENYGLGLGARDNESWHYTYNWVYNPKFENSDKTGEVEDYIPVVRGRDNWIIGETSFDIKEDKLVTIEKEKLSLVFSVPYLHEKPEYQNYTIPIDWIEIIVHKPGINWKKTKTMAFESYKSITGKAVKGYSYISEKTGKSYNYITGKAIDGYAYSKGKVLEIWRKVK